jgi:hypothetical protein
LNDVLGPLLAVALCFLGAFLVFLAVVWFDQDDA